MRNHAAVSPARRLSTTNYSEPQRQRLADAVKKARAAAGYPKRTEFSRAFDINLPSLGLLENAKPGVGESILLAVGRALPTWTEDTPRLILEGGDPPLNVATVPSDGDQREFFEWLRDLRSKLGEEQFFQVIDHASRTNTHDAAKGQ